ncbi:MULTISPECIES: hypothetical protein [Nitrosomonas]|nr:MULTISPECIES: hypothetical protein [Nitrosomonas]QOJ09025.1 MAG: hypothetical protein HRU73_05825 [Nitrosomonas sp. H1_AOB3]HBF25102.1 hypothetical protein [Nitrosomonas sp.]HNS58357.1 hypothetical protein [Nitrosomonas europaea]HRN82618.1 hypothetical protein [Nitrosomonas europaea]HRO55502.1 hypothetical protein [Nitrosomonas europaea]
MKQAAVILTGILVLLAGKSTTAISREPFHLENMTCSITSASMNGCTGVPTLHSGILTLSKEGTFKLKARYEGCFMVENVTKSGDFAASFFEKAMSLELLTTRTTGMKNALSDFPGTLGFAHLNYDGLDGYFIDISAVIRARGREMENVIVTANLQCTVIDDAARTAVKADRLSFIQKGVYK